MALRIQGTFKDYYDLAYSVEIFDNDYSGEPQEVLIAALTWGYETSQNEIRPGVLVGSAQLTIHAYPEHEAFLTDVLLSEEKRFLLKITETSLTNIIEFIGFLRMDMLTYNDEFYPFDITISAVDPISELKGISYSHLLFEETPITRKTFLEHLFNIIGLLEVDSYFTGAVVQITNNWYEARMKNTTDNPMTMARIPYSVFSEQDDLGEFKYFTAFEALQMICTQFVARFFYSQGGYKFEQINERANDTYNGYYYNIDGTFVAKLPVTANAVLNGISIIKLTGARYTAIPPVRAIQLIYSFNINDNYLHDIYDGFSNLSSPLYEIGIFALDDNVDYKWNFSGVLSWTISTAAPTIENFKLRFSLRIKVGDSYLKRSILYDVFFDPQFSPVTWTTVPSVYIIDTPYDIFVQGGVFNSQILFDIITPIIPDEGLVDIQFLHVDVLVFDSTNSQATSFTEDYEFSWNIQQPKLFLVGDGNERVTLDREVLVYSNNQNNSRIENINIRTGDGPNTGNGNRIQILDSADDWVESSAEWSVGGVGASVSIQRLILLELAKFMSLPVLQINGQIVFKDFAPSAHRKLKYNSEDFLFQSGKIDPVTATISATYFRLDLAPVDAGKISSKEILTANANSPNSTLSDPDQQQILVNRPQYEVFENHEGVTLELDENKVNILPLLSIGTLERRQRLHVYKNGQKLILNVAFTIDPSTNTITLNSDYEGFSDYYEVLLFA